MYLAQEFELYGSRLQYVYWNTIAPELGLDGRALIAQIAVPEQRHLPTEMGYITSLLDGYVCAAGVTDDLGEQSVIVLQAGPDEGDLRTLLTRACRLGGKPQVSRQRTLDAERLRTYYWEAGLPSPGLGQLGFTGGLTGLVAELCGYYAHRLVEHIGSQCALPGEAHDCQNELYSDVFQAWLDGYFRAPDEDGPANEDGPDPGAGGMPVVRQLRRGELPEPPIEVLRKQFRESVGREPHDDDDARMAYWLGWL